jgi:DNA topoisomerase-1
MTPEEVTAEAAEKLLAQKAEGPKKLGLDPDSGLPIYALSGRFGPYVQLGEKSEDSKPKMKSLPRGMKETDVTLPEAQFLLSLPNELGVNPANSEPVVLDLGRFGPYIKCGAESRSLKAEDSIFTMTLARALELLAQEKTGRSGRRITKKTVLKDLGDGLQILDGRYGPYVTDGKKNASLPKESDASAFTREEAEILLEKKKATRKKKS